MISSACRRCTKYSWKSSSSPVAIVRTVRTGSSDIGMIVASTSRARAIAAVVSVRVRPVSSSRARSWWVARSRSPRANHAWRSASPPSREASSLYRSSATKVSAASPQPLVQSMDDGLERALARSRSGESLTGADILSVLTSTDDELVHVLERARELRDAYLERIGLPAVVTYSRKVFIPLTYLCRYRCSYCTFVRTRETPGAEYRSLQDVREIAERGREWGCTEALFTLGEAPELRHDEARSWLAERGHSSTISYLLEAARVVLTETGLLPHANPGAVTREEMTRIHASPAAAGLPALHHRRARVRDVGCAGDAPPRARSRRRDRSRARGTVVCGRRLDAGVAGRTAAAEAPCAGDGGQQAGAYGRGRVQGVRVSRDAGRLRG